MITRRELLKLGGLTISVMLTPMGYRILKAQEVPKRYAPNLWINLSRDNYLTVFVNKSEMGQGVYTGLPMLIAEELDFPWDRVRVAPAPAGRAYVDPKMGIQLTGGSTSVRNMYETLRLAGASMKEMLISSASKSLSIPKEKIRAERGYITAEGKSYPGELRSSGCQASPASREKIEKALGFRALVSIEESVKDADLVIGAVLIPGALAPKLITRDMLSAMKPGSVLVDVAIDQGGCAETSRPTTHDDPVYVAEDVIHYCVANMPGGVPKTSTHALNNATLPFVIALAGKGWRRALEEDRHLLNGLNVWNGKVTCAPVAEALGYDYVPPETALR